VPEGRDPYPTQCGGGGGKKKNPVRSGDKHCGYCGTEGLSRGGRKFTGQSSRTWGKIIRFRIESRDTRKVRREGRITMWWPPPDAQGRKRGRLLRKEERAVAVSLNSKGGKTEGGSLDMSVERVGR